MVKAMKARYLQPSNRIFMELYIASTEQLDVILKRLTPDLTSFSWTPYDKNHERGTFSAGVSPLISGTWKLENTIERRRRESKSLLDMDND
jgi:hypothetical protein